MSGDSKTPAPRRLFRRRDFIRGGASLGLGLTAPLHSSQARGRQRSNIAARDDVIWGVCGHPFTAYPGISIGDQLKTVTDLGFTHYRVNTREDGSPDLLEQLLNAGDSSGVTILPILGHAISLDENTPKDLKDASFELGKRMASRFKGWVPIWELGNELETYAILNPCEMRDDGTQYPCEWGPASGVGAGEYFGPRWAKVSAVLSGLAEGVAAGDRRAIRAMGTAGFGHIGAFERMKNDGIPYEIAVWHDYETISEDFLKILKSYGRPIWVTEFNAGAWNKTSDEDNARQLTERIAYYRKVRKEYQVTAAFAYELFDEPYWGSDPEAKMGLVSLKARPQNDGGYVIDTIKPQGVAMRNSIRRGA